MQPPRTAAYQHRKNFIDLCTQNQHDHGSESPKPPLRSEIQAIHNRTRRTVENKPDEGRQGNHRLLIRPITRLVRVSYRRMKSHLIAKVASMSLATSVFGFMIAYCQNGNRKCRCITFDSDVRLFLVEIKTVARMTAYDALGGIRTRISVFASTQRGELLLSIVAIDGHRFDRVVGIEQRPRW